MKNKLWQVVKNDKIIVKVNTVEALQKELHDNPECDSYRLLVNGKTKMEVMKYLK